MRHQRIPGRVRPVSGMAAAVAVTVFAAAGCGDDSADATGDGGDQITVDVGTLPIANAAPMYLGMEEGFFEEEGLEIEPTVLQGGNEIITGLVSGDYDFGFVGYISAGVALSQNVPVCVVTASDATGTTPEDDWQVLVAGADNGIESPQDLAGATLGINALGGVAEVLIKAALDADGVDPNSVEFIEVPFPEVPAAVAEGRIDAGYTSEPFVTTVLDQGGEVVYAPQSELAPEYPNGSYAASEQFIAENGDVVERFTRAMNRSLDYARENEDAVRSIIPSYTEIDPAVAERMRLPVYTSELDEQAIDEQMGFMEQFDIVEAAPTADDLICG
ncbi:ABC transporter substrate-binding protein [Phytoactinopolyspora halotolerans]|uniref:ABC transporter substrate-binding protein n=1 Tax=Phytoactinopolyspora halotolerans TaxID=1981512 RepID=A0A6L9S4Y4_9ACTN|nr:ABC transporter substrate-binding protein [Phytoactinopolyspora halotolerans]NED99099.1 ABC transporter substrate-binding protein [Phytoactinopolyspora halotolerans]